MRLRSEEHKCGLLERPLQIQDTVSCPISLYRNLWLYEIRPGHCRKESGWVRLRHEDVRQAEGHEARSANEISLSNRCRYKIESRVESTCTEILSYVGSGPDTVGRESGWVRLKQEDVRQAQGHEARSTNAISLDDRCRYRIESLVE